MIKQISSNPKRSFTFFRDYIGMTYSDDLLAQAKEMYDYVDIVPDENGLVAFKIPGSANQEENDEEEPEDEVYTSAELLAMIFGHAKELAETKAQSKIQDVVVTVPQHYDMNQRVMLQEAAELVKLRVLAMVHENTAAAINYGVDRFI